jgi:hypothetical protein
MMKITGKSERDAKFAISNLKQFLITGQPIQENFKDELIRICDALLEDKNYYDKSEKGRKAETNFITNQDDHFQVYLLKNSGFSNDRILELVPLLEKEERNISRFVSRVKVRLSIKGLAGDHWHKREEGFLSGAYDKLVATRMLTDDEYLKVENYLESIIEYTSYSVENNMFLISRAKNAERLGISQPEERELFLNQLRDWRTRIIKRNRTSK